MLALSSSKGDESHEWVWSGGEVRPGLGFIRRPLAAVERMDGRELGRKPAGGCHNKAAERGLVWAWVAGDGGGGGVGGDVLWSQDCWCGGKRSTQHSCPSLLEILSAFSLTSVCSLFLSFICQVLLSPGPCPQLLLPVSPQSFSHQDLSVPPLPLLSLSLLHFSACFLAFSLSPPTCFPPIAHRVTQNRSLKCSNVPSPH